MAGIVTWERLRQLASFRAQRGCAVSFYVGLDPSVAPTAADVEVRVKSLVSAGEKSESEVDGLGRDERQALRSDLERIRRWFDEDFDRDGARGVAVFAAELDGVWEPLPLAEPVSEGISVGRTFQLAPLVPLVASAEGALVAVVSRERGQVLRVAAGRLEEVEDSSGEQPGRHDQGGWSQARFQRHIDELAAEHFRTVAASLDRLAKQSRGTPIVVVCAEEIRSEFAELLAQETRDSLAGWTQAEAHAGARELLEAAMPVIHESRARRDAETLARWREEAGRSGRATAGWEQTLAAASDARVDVLLYEEGATREAWQCPQCGRAATSPGECPLDGSELLATDGLDAAVQQTLAHGGTARMLPRDGELGPVEGIAALLRF